MRFFISFGLVGLMAVWANWTSSQAQDAQKVGASLTLRGTLAKDTTKEIHKVQLEQNTTYTIDMISPNRADLDPFLRLYDAAGTLLAIDDDSGGDLNARIVFLAPKSGVYHIEASSFGSRGVGPYTISVNAGAKKIAAPKMSPFDRDALSALFNSDNRRLDAKPLDMFIANYQTETTVYGVVQAEFKTAEACKTFAAKGTHVFYRFDRFAGIFVGKKEALLALDTHPELTWLDVIDTGYLPPPALARLAEEKPRGKSESLIRGGIDVPQTGKGVILAIIDSGVDYHHPDLIIEEAGQAKSRLLYFWDTMIDVKSKTEPLPPVTYPDGTPIGALYTQAQLSAALAGKGYVPAWDTNGHGTACASVAAGNGRAASEALKKQQVGIGVAPEADLIAVRIGGANGTVPNMFLLGAICEWVEKIARERKQPYVISCSFGGHYGGHDGDRVAERLLDAQFPPDAPGRAICISAGNDGDRTLHAEATFAGENAPAKLSWQHPMRQPHQPNQLVDPHIILYVDGAEADDLVFGKSDVDPFRTFHHPLSGCVVSTAQTRSKDNGSGRLSGTMSVWSKSGKKVKLNAYLDRGTAYFTGPGIKHGRMIGSPASARNAIAVGSYDWNSEFHRYGQVLDFNVTKGLNEAVRLETMTLGALSGYSNHGPSRTGQIRPDIAAPGQWHCSAAAGNIDSIVRDSSGRYRIFNGTSAACPYTAGVIALMMQKNSKVTLGQIRELFRNHAVSDDLTGPVPNPGWGYGRLNPTAVRAMLKAIP